MRALSDIVLLVIIIALCGTGYISAKFVESVSAENDAHISKSAELWYGNLYVEVQTTCYLAGE